MHAVDQRLRQRRRPVGLRHGRVQRERAADLLAQGEPGRELRAGDVAIVALEAVAVVAELGDRHRARRQRDRVLHEEGADAALAGGRQAAADRGGVVGRHLVVEGVEHEGHGVVGPAEREAGVGRRPDAVRRGRVRAFRPDREQADLVEELLVDVGDGPVERGVDGEGAGGVDRPVQDRVGRVHVVVARAAAVDPGAERRGEFREAQRDPLALGRREGGLGEPGEVGLGGGDLGAVACLVVRGLGAGEGDEHVAGRAGSPCEGDVDGRRLGQRAVAQPVLGAGHGAGRDERRRAQQRGAEQRRRRAAA